MSLEADRGVETPKGGIEAPGEATGIETRSHKTARHRATVNYLTLKDNAKYLLDVNRLTCDTVPVIEMGNSSEGAKMKSTCDQQLVTDAQAWGVELLTTDTDTSLQLKLNAAIHADLCAQIDSGLRA